MRGLWWEHGFTSLKVHWHGIVGQIEKGMKDPKPLIAYQQVTCIYKEKLSSSVLMCQLMSFLSRKKAHRQMGISRPVSKTGARLTQGFDFHLSPGPEMSQISFMMHAYWNRRRKKLYETSGATAHTVQYYRTQPDWKERPVDTILTVFEWCAEEHKSTERTVQCRLSLICNVQLAFEITSKEQSRMCMAARIRLGGHVLGSMPAVLQDSSGLK